MNDNLATIKGKLKMATILVELAIHVTLFVLRDSFIQTIQAFETALIRSLLFFQNYIAAIHI